MSFDRFAYRLAIVGTGTIAANWAACHLSWGFDACATEPAPGAEVNHRERKGRKLPDDLVVNIDRGCIV